MNRRDLRDLLDAVERALEKGDEQAALALLTTGEARVFLEGDQVAAGELGYARREIQQGDVPGALAVLRALAERRRP